MTIEIQFVKTETSDSISAYVTQRLESLYTKYENLIRANVILKQENESGREEKNCSIELSLPGPRIFASSTKSSYEAAVKKTIEELVKQLKKRKTITLKTINK
ncbi:MAG: HPF/RaiA family ribosome-associated protein [Leeuwenhoekiella sp.]